MVLWHEHVLGDPHALKCQTKCKIELWQNVEKPYQEKIDFHNEMSMLTTNKSVCVGEEYKVGHSSITENKLHKPFSIRR